jgi:beta-glucanase (GH16 family)
VKNSELVLHGIKNTVVPSDPRPYLTGALYTHKKEVFGFGRLEIRAKFSNCRGAWPAFWLMPEDSSPWPDGGEIDIMERLNYDHVAHQTVHSYYTEKLHIHTPKPSATGEIDATGYNTYAVEKVEGMLKFYINGKQTFFYPRIKTDKKGQYPFDRDYYLLLDMQLGGSWVGPIHDEDLPATVWIDWVRFYKAT